MHVTAASEVADCQIDILVTSSLSLCIHATTIQKYTQQIFLNCVYYNTKDAHQSNDSSDFNTRAAMVVVTGILCHPMTLITSLLKGVRALGLEDFVRQ